MIRGKGSSAIRQSTTCQALYDEFEGRIRGYDVDFNFGANRPMSAEQFGHRQRRDSKRKRPPKRPSRKPFSYVSNSRIPLPRIAVRVWRRFGEQISFA